MDIGIRGKRRRLLLAAGMALAISTAGQAQTPARSATRATAPASAAAPALLVLGDSLSAEYGIARGAGWVTLLQDRLRQERFDYSVVNASISGETTIGGKTRLPDLLSRHRPAIVVIELGANDALRGLPLQTTEANLRNLVTTAQKAGASVLLIGMRIPPNYGQDYTEKFVSLYPRLAGEYKVRLVPFFLDQVIARQDWFQPDRIHPTAAAQPALLDTVWPQLKPLLKRGTAK
ncbi:arylesterase [Cupriavidus necator]|uniref:arylesterase n=1 Tax=Cupriavidus necator TaxID=106590 RepID=UPI00148F4DAC|nr:arylesterase [Cupriavidus necator]NOV23942.1 arylesterase [Cupriavidus necator]